MAQIRGALNSAGVVSPTFRMTEPGTLRYYLTGSYSATVYLQRATSSDETAWATVHTGGGPFLGAGEVAGNLTVTQQDSFRWYMPSYTSGSAEYLLTDEDEEDLDPNATTEDEDDIDTTNDLLTDILVELRTGNTVVKDAMDAELDLDDVRSAEREQI